ncbi:MAG: bifunctional DNA-formamidopyrimidine glycosylase/DNA-(apurinic or apyrimidinic site) lyase [Victivallaceae bacterium]|nr:bifunctional DNA-formamidopyrimidine glycosylase/DNA-(apurinic or apyrimidinic site) lyase [Victivallaceae bacterium]
MPELPEAECIGRALDRALSKRTITKVEVFTPAMRTSLLPLLDAGLPGHAILEVRRRGRYLVADLDDGRGLLMHFGMSGVVRVEPPDVPKRKHEHVFIYLSDGKVFRFECTRRFSLLEVCDIPAPGEWPEQLSKLGVEPLEKDFTAEYMADMAKRRGGNVKNFVMDNTVVVGIGNIYSNESLFEAGIRPDRPACDVTTGEWKLFVSAARRILKESIASGGTTISDFLNVDGTEGKYVLKLRIYGKTGEPCPVCKSTIETMRLGGRSSFFCPRCQK